MTNKMWGGRFQTGPDAIMEEINASIGFDKRLFRQDIAGSKAHAAMLAKQGIISKPDAALIRKGLDQVQAEIEAGTFTFSRALEDIHLNVESRLKDIIGPAAGRLHTARSRNDQVALDFRLYVRDTVDHLDAQLKALQLALASKAEAHAATVKQRRPGNLIAVACGEKADPDVLKHVTETVLVMKEMTPDAFKQFFKWVSASIKQTSQKIGAPAPSPGAMPPVPGAPAAPTVPAEGIALPPPPPQIVIHV